MLSRNFLLSHIQRKPYKILQLKSFLKNMSAKTPNEILDFWFGPDVRGKKMWYKKDPEFDELLRKKFGDLHKKAANEELTEWLKEPESALALIILLDQFSRNMFRDDPKSFAFDKLAQKYATASIEKAHDKKLIDKDGWLNFMYIPYMHSEDKSLHEKAVQLYSAPDVAEKLKLNYDFELKHKKIIDMFGRYPHRNAILGRKSTPEEIEYLKTDSGF